MEADIGTSVGTLLNLTGGAVQQVQALLIGGYYGTWLPAGDMPVSVTGLRPHGATPEPVRLSHDRPMSAV